MTRFQKLKKEDLDGFVRFLCDLFTDIGCDNCPVESKCNMGENGFRRYLNETN